MRDQHNVRLRIQLAHIETTCEIIFSTQHGAELRVARRSPPGTRSSDSDSTSAERVSVLLVLPHRTL
jgi:hypothetical protein